jgi:F-type H+-transporting ATPase subunit gamma
MGRFRKVDQQRKQLQELYGIIDSMKTLAQLELHKLNAVVQPRRDMGRVLEQVASEFLHFYPRPAEKQQGKTLWMLVGSERGFCGDFNNVLIRHLQQTFPECRDEPQRVLAVGRKLWLRMEEAVPGFIPLSGTSVSEELTSTLASLVHETRNQLMKQQATSLYLISHGEEPGEVFTRRLLPPEESEDVAVGNIAPLLQTSPDAFFSDFLPRYLYLTLVELFTASLLAENYYRVQHLEGAVNRLEERIDLLGGRARALRQEEITDEIETILLGSGEFSSVTN